MRNLKTDLWSSKFSHIYIEEEAYNYALTKDILKRFRESAVINIKHYKDVFNRSHQSYSIQKKSPKLILAVKKDKFLYNGSNMCESFGRKNFYYTSTMMNCIYDCEYCYLQGMYTSSNIVIFVNIEDVFKEITQLLQEKSIYLCISYETDLLALDGITGYFKRWMDFAKANSNLELEVRTKSANISSIQKVDALSNVILAWTLSPQSIIESYELRTPSLKTRLKAIDTAINSGWKVRLCFDPLIYVKNWDMKYTKMIDEVFSSINSELVYDIEIGLFRISKEFLKRFRKLKDNSEIFSYPYNCNKGICTYSPEHTKKLLQLVYNNVRVYIDEDRVYVKEW